MTLGLSSSSGVEQLYEMAARQAGYFSSAQAQQAGLSRRQISYNVKTRRFTRASSLSERRFLSKCNLE